jgi:pyruvate dehydrogenase E2 component (dihydrolipoamide acetyltransferase)
MRVPDIGAFRDVEVVEVLVRPGDAMRPSTPLITLETDKATMEVPATAAGRRASRSGLQRGARVSQGDLVVIVEASSSGCPRVRRRTRASHGRRGRGCAGGPARACGGAAPSPEHGRGVGHTAGSAPATEPPIDEPTFSRAHASPSVRKFARELGVDLAG